MASLIGVSMVATMMTGFMVAGKSTSKAAGELSGTLVLGGWPAGDTAFKSIEKGFLAKYPKITIKYQFASTADYTQALQTSLAA